MVDNDITFLCEKTSLFKHDFSMYIVISCNARIELFRKPLDTTYLAKEASNCKILAGNQIPYILSSSTYYQADLT